MSATTPTNWRPSPALTAFTRTVLQALSRRWPKAMSIALGNSTAAAESFADFAFALRDIDSRVAPFVAREYIAEHDFAPGPHELRVAARAVEKREFPGEQTSAPAVPPPPIDDGRDHLRIAELMGRAHARFGSYRVAMRVWDRALELAPDEQAKRDVRTGAIDDASFNRAMNDVQDAIDRASRLQAVSE